MYEMNGHMDAHGKCYPVHCLRYNMVYYHQVLLQTPSQLLKNIITVKVPAEYACINGVL